MKPLQQESITGLISVIVLAIVFSAGIITPGILVLDYVHGYGQINSGSYGYRRN